ncbi:CaiB/BaiF CoA transferase family protein [Nonomuraea sp. KM88]|uniref:CaiB/BaiF CoA transferase family protein n=1 Tax=Nonomuraea sp. KM88 TaxID=3457427 RepID=UPI003FCEC960
MRVVEVGHAVAAPLCARHLADLGADVVKVEAPAGDLARGYDSVVDGDSAYFAWANYGKRSVVLDLRSDGGSASFERLVSQADVLVHNLAPGAMSRLGFDHEHLAGLNPRLVNCAISGYGTSGPMADRKAFDLLIQGESGLMSVTGTEEELAKVGISVVDMCTAVYALAAVQAALIERSTTGAGRLVEISMLDCIAEWMMAPAYHQIHANSTPRREGARHNMMIPYGLYRTGSSTSVNFAIQTTSHWRALCEDVLGAPELTEHPDFATNADRVRNRGVLEPRLEELLTAIGHEESVRRLLAAGIPSGEVNDLRGLIEHPQLRARDRWMSIRTSGGLAPTVRAPFNLRTDNSPVPSVPALGEHTASVLAELNDAGHGENNASPRGSALNGSRQSEDNLPWGTRNGEHRAS